MQQLFQDVVYNRILEKFKNGTFSSGQKIKDLGYATGVRRLNGGFSSTVLTGEMKNYFIHGFTESRVYSHIQNNLELFHRQFFKDLIESNPNSIFFEANCFEIMPLEYIDEEMCSLAILNSTNWTEDKWFYSVLKRKPEALTEDIWKLAARLYATSFDFVDQTPSDYLDKEYFLELCNHSFSKSSKIVGNKDKMLDCVPDEFLNSSFILQLLGYDIDNVSVFSEERLEKEIAYVENFKANSEAVWQYAIRKKAETIQYIPLNEERIEYFLRCYSKNSQEFDLYLKDSYNQFMKEKRNNVAYLKLRRMVQENPWVAKSLIFSNSKKVLKSLAVQKEEFQNIAYLPKNYFGEVPLYLRRDFTSCDYIRYIYEEFFGIEVLDDSHGLFYKVNLPENWKVYQDGYWYFLKNELGEDVMHYLYYRKEFVSDAYVKAVNIPIEKLNLDDQSLNRQWCL